MIDRCNLTTLPEPGMEDLAEVLAANHVEVVASLPCYGPENVETQRGPGVFAKVDGGSWPLRPRWRGCLRAARA